MNAAGIIFQLQKCMCIEIHWYFTCNFVKIEAT